MIEQTDGGLVRIQSSELLFLENELANIGSRALAFAVDTLIKGGAAAVILLLASVSGVFKGRQFLIPATVALVIYLGYHVLLETESLGRTPGKTLAGIRVVKADGSRLTLLDVLVRNVLRLVDSLPFGYAVGMSIMFSERYNRRIGDMVAGTLVIYDRPSRMSIEQFVENRLLETPPALLANVRGLAGLSDEEKTLVKTLYLRLYTLAEEERQRILERFHAQMSTRVDLPGITDPERFLYEIYKRV